MSVNERALQAEKMRKHEAACREIKKHLPSFLIVGEQLLIIRDLKMYLVTHKTLENFVEDVFGIERRRAYQYMESAAVKVNLCTSGTQNPPILPRNERQFREVAKAPAELQADVVKKVVEKAAQENRKPTHDDYKKVVGELLSDNDQAQQEQRAVEQSDDADHPKHLAGPIMAHSKALSKMLNEIKKLATERGGEWIDVQSISISISEIKHSLKYATYYADCAECSGRGCAKCKGSGFMPLLKADMTGDK